MCSKRFSGPEISIPRAALPSCPVLRLPASQPISLALDFVGIILEELEMFTVGLGEAVDHV